eukprot:CAMPEP_0170061732 /NCGR_PEP_ID=MMETSP0019_2-20121128/3199_1 /TAXON_ID=98059 /ORGANISM="Dinobryon sp., Strain UTEXLB2267" /LENGTH=437 /DNA_ID=CAMNT_0010267655 /DNA_START=258 /DNA_END=1571 /DNA_ORIENTATION=+
MVKCSDSENIDTYFRCILVEDEFVKFSEALQTVSHEYDAKDTINILHHGEETKEREKKDGVVTLGSKLLTAAHNVVLKRTITNQSVMRRSVAMEMDKFDMRSKIERIRARRGSFKSLPVFFSNDLVHGSWWFTIGSVVYTITSLVVFVNSYDPIMGEDDSTLSPYRYRASWMLMVLSGLLFTLGSLAFIRAMHDDPPMKALFPDLYHIQSDELLGSWLFLLGTVIFVPYCLIFVAGTADKFLYLGLMAVAIIVSIGTYLFVRACYPSEEDVEHMKIIKPISRVMCYCCLSRSWMKKHMPNDWLAGAWFIYWAMVFATFASFIILIYTLVFASLVNKFVLAWGFFSNVCFLLGAAYFVSGSYPEKTILAGVDDDSEEIVPKEITSSANDFIGNTNFGKFLNHHPSSTPSPRKPQEEHSHDIEALNTPFISTTDKSSFK